MQKNFGDLFKGLGRFEKPYKILLKENSVPVARQARRVPFAVLDKLKEKLNELEKNGIIAKTDDYSEWCHVLVLAPKKDKFDFRLCIDPHDLNKCILDETFLIPTLEDLKTKLKGVKYFTVLDLKDGFWQIALDEESQKLCTFATPFGNYKFLRMPFGIKSGPKVFGKMNHANFGDILNVFAYMDDILVTGKTREEHDRALLEVLNRAREKGVKFNLNKMQLAVNKVKYLGHIFSEDEMTPDSDRIEAIKEMGEPKDKTDLRKFLGVVGTLRPFVSNLSQHTEPLRELLKKNVIYRWTERQTDAFNKIKQEIVNAPILVPFDESKEIEIECDASKDGLGCSLLQDRKPISFASRSLSQDERGYSQIEKEFLSILFACKKFEFYTYGRKIKIRNDHKPLTSIIRKEIHKIPSAKLQNIRLKLLRYDIELEYAPGKTIHIADYLSRYAMQHKEEDVEKDLINAVLSINVSNERKIEFQKETESDVVLKNIKNYCLNGWPRNKSKCADNAKFYFKMRNEIMIDDDILFWNERIIVPTSMRLKMLKQLHEPHFGITKTKKRAKNCMYWPGIDSDIEKMISACHICQVNANKNQKEPLIPHEIPSRPFEKLASDIFEYGGKSYLAVADYYSKWIEMKQLRGKQARDVNMCLSEIFSRNGIPKVIVADNMPFNSLECREFARSLDFKFETTSPTYAQSNGFSEKYVDICKNILKKTNSLHEINMALLEYRSTPVKDMSYSPAQLLQNRHLRTKMPMKDSKFEPILNENVKAELQKKQENMKRFYDRTAKHRNDFELNDKVYVWQGKWQKGIVTKVWHTPRSYLVKTENNEYRRNSRDLRRRIESGGSEPDYTLPTTNPPNSVFARKCTRSGRQY